MSEIQYETVMEKLNNLSKTHPNISNIWKEYINLKKYRLEYAISTCIDNIENMKEINDPSLDTLSFIMYFLQSNRNIT